MKRPICIFDRYLSNFRNMLSVNNFTLTVLSSPMSHPDASSSFCKCQSIYSKSSEYRLHYGMEKEVFFFSTVTNL